MAVKENTPDTTKRLEAIQYDQNRATRELMSPVTIALLRLSAMTPDRTKA
jgi:hypothetical protein